MSARMPANNNGSYDYFKHNHGNDCELILRLLSGQSCVCVENIHFIIFLFLIEVSHRSS